MNACEHHESALSSLIDGELEPVELIPTVDHLAACESCRVFYRKSRDLESLLLEATVRPAHSAPEAVWDRIRATEAEQGRSEARVGQRWPTWVALAASLLLVAGLGVMTRWGGSATPPRDAYVEVLLEQSSGSMTEERFVELAREVLEADRRYHQKMREVMELVTSRSEGREGPAEEHMLALSEEDGERTETSPDSDESWKGNDRAL